MTPNKKLFVLLLIVWCPLANALDPVDGKDDEPAVAKRPALKSLTSSRFVLPLKKEGGLWIDLKRKWVIVDGSVCVREGPLEMFICPAQTKEHESVLTTPIDAETVHTSLLAIGAKTGSPVQFQPEYKRLSLLLRALKRIINKIPLVGRALLVKCGNILFKYYGFPIDQTILDTIA